MKLVETKSWNILKSEFERIKNTSIKSMFVQDENRFVEFSLKFEDILFDYSKNLIDEEVLAALISLAKEANLSEKIELMFGGAKINITENRAVLHTALRNFSDNPVFTDGMDIMPMIIGVRDKMKDFTNQLRNNIWLGYNGDIITDVVNIGIGGSDLGPAMVCHALKPYSDGKINIHFVSNIDGTDLAECLKHLKPETTLFIIASKTFTTLETMTNANSAKDWFFAHSDADQDDVAKHFVALSTNEKACLEFGIPKANMFEFWDWVGGRYSLWSAIGLSIAVYVGYDNFEKLLYGAYLADCHFLETKFERNIPVIMGLLGVWYNNFMNFKTHAIIPYDQYLSKLPDFLQQLDMESNGKYTDIDGNTVDYHTGAVVWGTAGTNSQHSFFQLIHQGTQTIPVDFIVPCISHNPVGDHHQKLLANCFAQSEAMMIGKSEDEVIKELKSQGLDDEKINQLKQHKIFNGNIPTNTFLIKKITPESLGTLIAFYEHKVFVEGIIWNINSFDQWGVELGKQLAGKILPELKSDCLVKNHDSSTNGLINYYKNVIN